ncbi:hypothetical protein pb186bvf_016419 [Paramecium bursaria]
MSIFKLRWVILLNENTYFYLAINIIIKLNYQSWKQKYYIKYNISGAKQKPSRNFPVTILKYFKRQKLFINLKKKQKKELSILVNLKMMISKQRVTILN